MSMSKDVFPILGILSIKNLENHKTDLLKNINECNKPRGGIAHKVGIVVVDSMHNHPMIPKDIR